MVVVGGRKEMTEKAFVISLRGLSQVFRWLMKVG
jgi:hypothetical protein